MSMCSNVIVSQAPSLLFEVSSHQYAYTDPASVSSSFPLFSRSQTSQIFYPADRSRLACVTVSKPQVEAANQNATEPANEKAAVLSTRLTVEQDDTLISMEKQGKWRISKGNGCAQCVCGVFQECGASLHLSLCAVYVCPAASDVSVASC